MKKIIAFILLSLTTFYAGCNKDSNPVSNPDPANKETVVLNAATKEPEKVQGFINTTVSPTQLVVNFNNPANIPNYKTGDIIIGQSNEGYLRKVKTATTLGSSLIIETEYASIDECFDKAAIDSTYDFIFPQANEINKYFTGGINNSGNSDGKLYKFVSSKPDAVVSTNGKQLTLRFPNVKLDVNDANTGGQASVKVDTLIFDVDAQIKELKIEYNFGLKKFKWLNLITPKVRFVNTETVISGAISQTDSIKLLTVPVPLGHISTPIGTIVPQFYLLAGVAPSFRAGAGITGKNSASFNIPTEIGLEVIGGVSKVIGNASATGQSDLNFSQTTSIDGELKVFVKPVITAKLYGLGLDVFVKPYEYQKISYPPFQAEIGAGVLTGLSASMGIFSKTLFNSDFTLADFRTKILSSSAPAIPNSPNPSNGAQSVSMNKTLSWQCSDPDGNPLKYDVYLGTSPSPATLVSHDQSQNSFIANGLNSITTYYWQIIAKDSSSLMTSSPIWSFTTVEQYIPTTISGKITDSLGQPLSNVKVYTNPESSIAYSDVSGNYTLGSLGGGAITIYALKTGYKDYIISINLTKGQPHTQNISMTQSSGSTNITMIPITGGTFTMGAPDITNPHQVTLSSYSISKTEITHGQYQAIMGTNPSYFQGLGPVGPVEQVSWYNCISFCNKLSIAQGKTPCYSINGNIAPPNWTTGTIVCNWTANGYRLPTEAEWEFAAKGGNLMQTPPYTFSGSNKIDDVTWYYHNCSGSPHIVGGKSANELGLFDMSGNVWEWCWDWYELYSSNSQTNPTGPNTGTYRIIRGGSYSYFDYLCHVSYRTSIYPDAIEASVGFRVVLP